MDWKKLFAVHGISRILIRFRVPTMDWSKSVFSRDNQNLFPCQTAMAWHRRPSLVFASCGKMSSVSRVDKDLLPEATETRAWLRAARVRLVGLGMATSVVNILRFYTSPATFTLGLESTFIISGNEKLPLNLESSSRSPGYCPLQDVDFTFDAAYGALRVAW